MRLLLVGALAALAVALPTGYHRKPSANERSELHRRAAARWLNMEKRDACADLYDTDLKMRTFKAALKSRWGRKVNDDELNMRTFKSGKFEEYCRKLNKLKDEARRRFKESIDKLKLDLEETRAKLERDEQQLKLEIDELKPEIERKEQELEEVEDLLPKYKDQLEHLEKHEYLERVVDEELRFLLGLPHGSLEAGAEASEAP